MQTRGITVSGKVQGVFFRKCAEITAKMSGLSGFVRNTGDGKVYIEVTGPESAINEMISWCYKGSPASRVENVIVHPLDLKEYDGFRIVHS